MNMPDWWLGLSIVFFAMNTLLFFAIAYLLFKLGKTAAELRPKVESLIVTVDGVAKKVDALTTTVHETVKNVGQKATGITGSASVLAQTTSKVFERYVPLLAAVATGLKLLGVVRDFRASRQAHAAHLEKEES